MVVKSRSVKQPSEPNMSIQPIPSNLPSAVIHSRGWRGLVFLGALSTLAFALLATAFFVQPPAQEVFGASATRPTASRSTAAPQFDHSVVVQQHEAPGHDVAGASIAAYDAP